MKSAPNTLTYHLPGISTNRASNYTDTYKYICIYAERKINHKNEWKKKHLTTDRIVSTDCCWKIITVNRVPLIYMHKFSIWV